MDNEYFVKLFTNPKILELIPQKLITEIQIIEKFIKSLNLELSDLDIQKCTCGIYENENIEILRLALFLINENNEKEF